MEEESHGEEKEEELEIENLKQLRSNYALAAERSSAAFALAEFRAAHVSFGSKAEIGSASVDVRFTPKSGHYWA
jgi:hypothetical protein